MPSDYKQHDVPAVLDTIVNLFPHNIAIVLQLFLVQPLVLAAVTKLNPIHFFRAFFPAGVVAFTSESSIGTIPVTVRQLRSAGVPGDIASFVAGTEPSQRANITNDAKSDSANVSHQQSGFALNFAPNAMFSASGDDACCGTKPNK